MRVVAISDTHMGHGQLNLPAGDLLIHAGDATFRGTVKEVREFACWFQEQPFTHKVFVAGNHDWLFQRDRMVAEALLGAGIHYLQDSMCEIEGWKIWGSPWQPVFQDWAFGLPEDRLKLAFDLIPEDIDILVTHSPAFGVLDANPFGEPCGSSSLRVRLRDLQMEYHIFGHIHDSYGLRREDHYMAANVAICDEAYRVANLPLVFSMEVKS